MITLPSGAKWVISAQQHTTGIGPTGIAGPGWNITYMTAGGATGQLFVPDAQYTPDQVRALVDTAATTVDVIGGMTG